MILNESAPTGENVSRERCFNIMQANIYITQVRWDFREHLAERLMVTASFAIYGSSVP